MEVDRLSDNMQVIQADVVIIGAGPAGMSAALYASRANLKTLMIEAGAPGGELMNTAEIENYPGYPRIDGPDLAQHFYQSATAFGAEVVYGQVDRVEVDENNLKQVYVGDTRYEAPAVIVATGAHHRKLGLPSEEAMAGKGVSYCAVCDGFFFRNKEIVVVGGGDSAVEEGTYLTQFADKVTIIHRRDELRAQEILQERAFNNPKIDFLWNSVVEEFVGDEKLDGVQVRNIQSDEVTHYPAEGAFIYIGIVPNSSFLDGLNVMDEEGWVLTDDEMMTEVPGLFAAGDIRQKALRQVATAVGDGSTAGQAAYNYIQLLKD